MLCGLRSGGAGGRLEVSRGLSGGYERGGEGGRREEGGRRTEEMGAIRGCILMAGWTGSPSLSGWCVVGGGWSMSSGENALVWVSPGSILARY